MRVASWNVNSVRTRLPLLLAWLEANQPDLLCLQEIKCQEKDFPLTEITDAGFAVEIVGQKAYNGVAVISKQAVQCLARSLPKAPKIEPEQARFIEVLLGDIHFIGIYAPNGNPINEGSDKGDKFNYKIKWLEQLLAHARGLLAQERKVVIAGDFNIIPTKNDVWDEKGWLGDALYQPEVRALWRQFLWSGWTDAVAAKLGNAGNYTFWDYQRGAWQKNHGIRIDHFLLSPQAADCLSACVIDSEQRALEKPSDHVPVWIELDD